MPRMHDVALVGISRNSCAGHLEFFKDSRIASDNRAAHDVVPQLPAAGNLGTRKCPRRQA